MTILNWYNIFVRYVVTQRIQLIILLTNVIIVDKSHNYIRNMITASKPMAAEDWDEYWQTWKSRRL